MADRSLNQRCNSCQYYETVAKACKRYPPQIVMEYTPNGGLHVHYEFPYVKESQWCGEFKAQSPRSIFNRAERA